MWAPRPGSTPWRSPIWRGSRGRSTAWSRWRASIPGARGSSGPVPVPVEVVTLDQLCEASGVGRVDFVKIDVEGAELQVLEGSESVVGAWRPTVLVEIEERHTARYGQRAEEVVAWFEGRGYSMHTWVGAWRPAGAVCPQTRNYLFRPRPDPRTGPSPGSSAAPCPVAPCPVAPCPVGPCPPSAEVADGSRERAA